MQNYKCLAILVVATLVSGVCQSVRSQPAADGAPAERRDDESEGDRRDPATLLREATTYLGKLDAASYRMTMRHAMSSPGMKYDMTSKSLIRFQRPKRLAVTLEEGMMGATIVCDGEQVYQYVPALQRYTVADAPADFSEIDSSGSMMMSGMGGLLEITAFAGGESLYEQMMEGVTGSKHLGQQAIDGTSCHHCRFFQEDMNWELWIEAGERPLIRKIELDMAKQFAAAGEQFAEMFKDAKLEMSLSFHDWDTKPHFEADSFSFTPPDGAEQVESLFGDFEFGGDDGPHPLIGEEAPSFETVDLLQQPISLQKHLGKDVVILDFWASWCGPCVEAMPEISKVADAFKNKGVVFYAVNVGEEPKEIAQFLESKKLDVPVALDAKGEISDLYHADAIPQTVLIGKQGRVQVVHVGFSRDLEELLTAQLNSLLAGEDLAAATLAEAAKQREQRSGVEVKAEGIEIVWTVDGSWSGVAADLDQGGLSYVTDGRGKTAVVDRAGAIQRELKTARGGTFVRAANLVGGDACELVCFQGWGRDVRAYTNEGTELWTYSCGGGVDDVWAADLNSDGIDEVIIGYNGSTSLHVLDNQGTLLWKYTDIGNVWHVCAGDFDGDGEVDVLTTSASGQLHVFDSGGHAVGQHSLSIYANMVRTAQLDNSEGRCHAIVGGSGNEGEMLLAVDNQGKTVWSVELRGSDHIDSLAVVQNATAAVGMRGGACH